MLPGDRRAFFVPWYYRANSSHGECKHDDYGRGCFRSPCTGDASTRDVVVALGTVAAQVCPQADSWAIHCLRLFRSLVFFYAVVGGSDCCHLWSHAVRDRNHRGDGQEGRSQPQPPLMQVNAL